MIGSLQELVEEVRKELQKMKEEIIEGEGSTSVLMQALVSMKAPSLEEKATKTGLTSASHSFQSLSRS